MIGILVLLVFATVGSKILLGLAVIYALLPDDPSCPACDGETLPITSGRLGQLLGRVLRVQRRWCMGCGETLLARRHPERRVFVGRADEVKVREPTL